MVTILVTASDPPVGFAFLKRLPPPRIVRLSAAVEREEGAGIALPEALRLTGVADFVGIDPPPSQPLEPILSVWWPRVRFGGVLAVSPARAATHTAMERFFGRVGAPVYSEAGISWVRKHERGVSFIVPAFNCASTILDAVNSIREGNLVEHDEIVAVNDGSSDTTLEVLRRLEVECPQVKIVDHGANRGGGAARNTAVRNSSNPLIFCLDSDNMLAPSSVRGLAQHLEHSGADAAAFRQIIIYRSSPSKALSRWLLPPGRTTLADQLASHVVPGSSGNYLFTRQSWERAGGYPEEAGALDAWGFALRQLATGSVISVMGDGEYYHRDTGNSYWTREARRKVTSKRAAEVLAPFAHLLDDESLDRVFESECDSWFENLPSKPLKLRDGSRAAGGGVVRLSPAVRAKLFLRALLPTSIVEAGKTHRRGR
jgi:glycosyltransferase involved in cell wall biosynthesis